MKEFFHYKRSQVFKTARQKSTRKKQQKRVCQFAENKNNKHGPAAVYRAVRPVQKSSVYKFFLRNGAEYAFINPAYNAVYHKPKKQRLSLFNSPIFFSPVFIFLSLSNKEKPSSLFENIVS